MERKHREYGRIWSGYGAYFQAVVVVYSGANTALSLASLVLTGTLLFVAVRGRVCHGLDRLILLPAQANNYTRIYHDRTNKS